MSKKSKAVRAAKRHPKLAAAALIIIILIVIAAVVFYFIRPDLYHKYLGIGEHTYSAWQTVTEPTCGDDGLRTHTCEVCGEVEEEKIPATGDHKFNSDGMCTACGFYNITGTEQGAADAGFSVHIINLGKYAGDSIYIKAYGNDILIDAGSRADSAELICTYLDKYVTDGKLEYVVATHADQDHIAAFAGNAKGSSRTGVLYNYDVGTLIRFDNVDKDKQGKETNPNTVYGKFCAAVEYVKEQGAAVYTASQCYYELGGAKRQYWLDDGHTMSMNILYNYYYENVSADENNHSVVTLFTKDTAARKFHWLFTGDLEEDGESRMVDYYADKSNSKSEYDVLPDVDFYKAGHHGSGTSSTAKLLNVIKPEIVAISCCAGSPEYTRDNNNTFPYARVFENLLKHTDKIYCTSVASELPALGKDGKFESQSFQSSPCNGDIICYFNDGAGESAGNLSVWCDNSQNTVPETDWYKKYRLKEDV